MFGLNLKERRMVNQNIQGEVIQAETDCAKPGSGFLVRRLSRDPFAFLSVEERLVGEGLCKVTQWWAQTGSALKANGTTILENEFPILVLNQRGSSYVSLLACF